MKTTEFRFSFKISLILGLLFSVHSAFAGSFNISVYQNLADKGKIYPSQKQIEMLKQVVPQQTFQPAPNISDRTYWGKVASSKTGKEWFNEALKTIKSAPEIPIADSIYRRANKEGNRGIYKPRYYRTMERLESYIVAECMENKGQFIPQIEVYLHAIMDMKSWMHPNHDDSQNSVLEGKRVAIDLGARKFGSNLALAEVLLGDKLSADLRKEMAKQMSWRITDSYLKSCKGEDKVGNTWIRSTSNWNSVCTSGSVFTIIAASKNEEERIAAIGSALNSMVFYLSGFGQDGYCSEGIGYWGYGFGHYLYLAQILFDYSDGKINLFEFDNLAKLKNVGNFPAYFQIQNKVYPCFSDRSSKVADMNDNFANVMSAKYYDAEKPSYFKPEEVVQQLIEWNDCVTCIPDNDKQSQLPAYTFFDDFGIVISRGQQTTHPLSIAIKGGHNAENHNHSDVGSYVLVLDNQIITGDIGAPSYTAGAFSEENKARNSWGHPVPMVDNTLQSNGREYSGTILSTDFTKNSDKVILDIKSAYKVPTLTKLIRTMENDKTATGTISVEDSFSATKPIPFGTAIMTYAKFDIVNQNTIILEYDNKKIKAEITAKGGSIEIKPELVPVTALREGKNAMRLGIDFTQPLTSGSIVVKYSPVL